MQYQPAMYALLRLHAELGKKIKENKHEAKRLAADMVHVEAVLKMLKPGYDVRPIAVRRRAKGNAWFKRGTLFRHALDILREATDGPLTTREITLRMLAARGVKDAKPTAVGELVSSVLCSLRKHDGKSVRSVGEGMPVRWTIVP